MNGIKSGRLIGARIKQRRRELGLSQEKLAEALDVSYQQVQRYENGMNLLNTDKLQIVADFLEVPVGYFFEEAGFRVAETKGQHLSSDDTRFLRFFREINERYRKAILLFMKLAAK